MQYMLMCFFAEEKWERLPEGQRSQIMRDYGTFTQEIVRSGHFRANARLRPSAGAATLREKDGVPITSDGPVAETKEELRGYFLIECRDLEEAVAIARRIPTLPAGGAVEVRPVQPMYET